MPVGIFFARAELERDEFDLVDKMRLHGNSRVLQAANAGISYYDTPPYSVGWTVFYGYDSISALLPAFDCNCFIHTGHGSAVGMWGDYVGTYYKVIHEDTADSLSALSGKGVYSFSCLTAQHLDTVLLANGVVSYGGYTETYEFWADDGSLSDLYMVHTMSPGFKFIESIIANRTWIQCYQDTLAQFDTEIAYWESSGNPYASLIIASLLWDKNALEISGDGAWKLQVGPSTTGTINVTANISGATYSLAGAASYSGSGLSWSQAGATLGEYTITYGAVAGYYTPASTTQTLTAGGTISFTGTYIETVTTGTIVVNTNIASTFTVTGPATYSGSGTTMTQTGAPAGSYTITYGDVAGYTTPANETKTLAAGGTATFTGTYVAAVTVGTLVVTTNVVTASFTLTGPATYTGSGASWSKANALAGTYTITYDAVGSYSTPDPETKVLANGGTTTFAGTYVFVGTVGTIVVTTNSGSGSFSITGAGTYSGTGTSWSQTGANIGEYTIVYGAITGYNTPNSETKFLLSGETITFTGNYVAIGQEITETARTGGGRMSKTSNIMQYMNTFKSTFNRDNTDQPGLIRIKDGNATDNPFYNMPVTPGSMWLHSFKWTFSSAADVNSDNWTPGSSGVGTVLTVQDEAGGVAKVINAVTDNAYYYYLRKYGVVKLTSGKDTWISARFKVADVDEADLFVGCVKTPVGNIFDNRTDAFGFYMLDGLASLCTETMKDSTATQNTGLLTVADDTYVSLAIHVEGVSRIHFFGNTEGSKLKLLKSHVANLPDDEVLTFGFGCRNGKLFTGTGNAMSIGTIEVDIEK